MQFFPGFEKAKFLRRPNRFVVHCELNGEEVQAFLPNPGRLWELLFPDSILYLQKELGEKRQYSYTAIAVEREGKPIVLHTHKANDVAHHLLEKGLVPGLEDAVVLGREVKWENSRFDFLLRQGKKEIWLEVKSCTLFGQQVARFPDAVSARATKHLEELASLTKGNRQAAVLILAHWPQARYFFPEYHVDLAFAQSLVRLHQKLKIIPLAIQWTKKLNLGKKITPLEVPWKKIKEEAQDRGYLGLILYLDQGFQMGHPQVRLKEGYYLYLEKVDELLSKRLARYRRKRKRPEVPVDHLLAEGQVIADLPFLTGDEIGPELARSIEPLSEKSYQGFSPAPAEFPHLFYFPSDPLDLPEFHQIVHYMRMERLIG